MLLINKYVERCPNVSGVCSHGWYTMACNSQTHRVMHRSIVMQETLCCELSITAATPC